MIIPGDGMTISSNTRLTPGVYYLPNGIEIVADGVSLDGNGALLVGAGRSGQGVRMNGRRGVKIKNLRLSEYYHGIAAQGCANLTISNCAVSGTAEVASNTIFLDIWRPAEQAYGGGIFLHNVHDSRIQGNDLQHQQNGLLCYGCSRLSVRDNIASYCSGFGFHFFASSDCMVEANYADYCCRYEPRGAGTGHLGADAAGFLIAHGSCRNVFRRNNARMSGDGFFLAGLRPDWTHVPCDDNLFEENDGSYSPNIAFEATFSRGNIYRRNRANSCNYGFWLGFSSENTIEFNAISNNRRAGIAVENGVGFVVRDNEIGDNAYGLLLWSKYVAPFAQALPANDTSRDWLIVQNSFQRNGVAVRIAADQDHGVRDLPTHIPRCLPPHSHTLRANSFVANRANVAHIGSEAPVLIDNQIVV